MVKLIKYCMIIAFLMLNTCFKIGFTQEQRDKEDSLKTLKILQKTLDKILEEKRGQNGLDLEIDGLIVDQTITKTGRDFYDIFYSKWIAPPSSKNFTVVIKELPIIGLGTQITILVNNNEVFKQRVQPRYDVIESMAEYANSVTVKYLTDYENMKSQLENGDQQGTGIY